MKVAFLLALAMAKRVGELQALSCRVASHGPHNLLAYLPEFVAKTGFERNPLSCSFLVCSLEDFVGGLPEERLLCSVGAYLAIMASIALHPHSLFVSPRLPPRALWKNALSFFLRQVILDADAVKEGALPTCARSIWAVATSAAFLRNWSASKVLESATWRSNPVFASFYFCDISYSHSLGPFVAGSSFYHKGFFSFCFFSRFYYLVCGRI